MLLKLILILPFKIKLEYSEWNKKLSPHTRFNSTQRWIYETKDLRTPNIEREIDEGEVCNYGK